MSQFDESGKHRYLPAGEFEQYVRDAHQERAVAMGELLGDVCIWTGSQVKRLFNIPQLVHRFAKMLDVPVSAHSLEDCKTPEEVIAYANSIRDREPSFANDLISAASRDMHPLKSLVQAEGRLKQAV